MKKIITKIKKNGYRNARYGIIEILFEADSVCVWDLKFMKLSQIISLLLWLQKKIKLQYLEDYVICFGKEMNAQIIPKKEIDGQYTQRN